MEFHRGRLVDHIHLRVADIEAAWTFYAAVLAVFDIPIERMGEHAIAADELWIDDTGTPTTGLHLAFQAADEATVARFHEAALAAGGTDNGAPGPRDYHPGYYAAYAIAPDGANIEAVLHGPSSRSAESVVVTPA
ncbi:MAG: VOC family protein [Thermoleophilia bacterium]|nr:VOC family protein [Thermoleophilia bacterium]